MKHEVTAMSCQWLQIKGDPSVRNFLFHQSRIESLFDHRVDELLARVHHLLTMRGVFHAKIHFSSNQLTCWLYSDPYRYRVFVGEEIFSPGFVGRFDQVVSIEKPLIPMSAVARILAEFKRLRFKDENVYLRNASINLINGLVGMSFSCDGSHYIEYDAFFATAALF